MSASNYPPGVTGAEDYFYPPTCTCGDELPPEGEACAGCGSVMTEDGLVDADSYRELIEEGGTLSCTECGGGGRVGDPGDEATPPSSEACPACNGTGRRKVEPCQG